MVELPTGTFTTAWRAEPPLVEDDEIKSLHLLNDTIYAYTKENRVISISAAGGTLGWMNDVTSPVDILRPPLMVKDNVVFPTAAKLEFYSRQGQLLRSMAVGHNMRSSAVSEGEMVYVGLDFSLGGRIGKLDTTREYGFTRWELMTSAGVSAAPVFFAQTVYCAGEDGSVYAINEDRAPVWSLPDNVFKTDGRILADLKIDDYAVYVASTDSKLYALDRLTGKIRWQYFSGTALLDAPTPTADSVYQYVPGQGIAAITKSEGAFIRQARWVAKDGKQFLAADDQYVYLEMRDHSIAALDKATGEIKFVNQRRDFTVFAPNTKDGIIYAATKNGLVVAIRPVTKPGSVGEIVRNDLELEVVAVAK